MKYAVETCHGHQYWKFNMICITTFLLGIWKIVYNVIDVVGMIGIAIKRNSVMNPEGLATALRDQK